MTIYTLILYTAIAAGVVTGLTTLVRKPDNWLVDYIKNFVGCLFIFSGYVKAIDPMGTGFKMDQYLAEFNMGFFSSLSLAGSVFTIVLEVVLGIALILGAYRKWTTLTLIPLIIFFLFLTGYTSVTGNVTDCGCFGDFLKLKPIVSFSKDVFLFVLIMLLWFKRDDITPVFPTEKIAGGILGVFTVIAFYFCFSNFYFDLPVVDFRPFAIGVNVPEAKDREEADVGEKVLYYTLVNNKTQEVREVASTDFTADKSLWEQGTPWKVDKERTREEIIEEGSTSKIKEFIFQEPKSADDDSPDDTEFWRGVMADQNYYFMVISYSMDKSDKAAFVNTINPILSAAEKDGLKGFGITALATLEEVDAFRHSIQAAYPFYVADDILLKTIIRSNPGLMLMKDGVIVEKWHHRKAPSYAEIKKNYLK